MPPIFSRANQGTRLPYRTLQRFGRQPGVSPTSCLRHSTFGGPSYPSCPCVRSAGRDLREPEAGRAARWAVILLWAEPPVLVPASARRRGLPEQVALLPEPDPAPDNPAARTASPAGSVMVPGFVPLLRLSAHAFEEQFVLQCVQRQDSGGCFLAGCFLAECSAEFHAPQESLRGGRCRRALPDVL